MPTVDDEETFYCPKCRTLCVFHWDDTEENWYCTECDKYL